MEAYISKFLNGAKGAFSLTFDDGCYKDSTLKVVEIFKEIEGKTGVKIKATSAQTVNFLNGELISMWRELIALGYFDVASHSVDHCIGYSEATPEEKRLFDAEKSRDMLKEIYGEAPICFVIPGGGQTRSACELLSRHYLANRVGEGPINDVDCLDFMSLTAFVARFEYENAQPFVDYIDSVIEKGGYGIQINHWITDKENDIFHSQRVGTFRDECMYLAKKQLQNELWIASFNDAIKYFYERNNAKILIQGDEITISHSLDRAIFNMPLTLIVKSDSDKEILVNGTKFSVKRDIENIITVQI